LSLGIIRRSAHVRPAIRRVAAVLPLSWTVFDVIR